MLIFIKEVTSDGDTFGFGKDSRNNRTNRAVRTFKLQVDGNPTTYISDCLNALPKFGDVHPSYSNCFVTDVECKATKTDPHIYEAQVTYEKNDLSSDGSGPSDDTDLDPPAYPWQETATITVSSSVADMHVSDLAYAYFGSKVAANAYNADGTINLTSTLVSSSPQVQILNTLDESPANLPEEPRLALQLTIEFAIYGQNLSSISSYLENAFTVNNTQIRIRDWFIEAYTAYLENVVCTPSVYNYNDNSYPYWKVSLTVSVRRDSWVLVMSNMSLNYKKDADGQSTKQPIQVWDAESGMKRNVSEAMRIDLNSRPIDVNVASGFLIEPRPAQNQSTVNLYLTKRPANWSEMLDSINL